ncbi:unnamed protein product, partial [Didymodactylos carnosus]
SNMSVEPKSWPEFVGKDANEVEAKIRAEGYEPKLLKEGSPTTRDYRENRVFVFYDENTKTVTSEPRTG